VHCGIPNAYDKYYVSIGDTCFDSIESSSGPQGLQIQFLQGSQVHCGIPNADDKYYVSIGDPTVHLTTCKIGSVISEGLKMTRWVETCSPCIYSCRYTNKLLCQTVTFSPYIDLLTLRNGKRKVQLFKGISGFQSSYYDCQRTVKAISFVRTIFISYLWFLLFKNCRFPVAARSKA